MNEALIRVEGLCKSYGAGDLRVDALVDVDLAIAPGTLVVVTGRSGSGKTTLLNLLGGLDEPTAGTVTLDGLGISTLADDERASLRRTGVGFVFQAFGLLPILTAAENVEVPMRLAKVPRDERIERSRVLLEMVGLGERADHRPDELSGGEQQRVAIARAIANRPRLLLADEPTGQLDSRTGGAIVELLAALVRSQGIAAVIASHDPAPLAVADRVIELSDGRLIADAIPNP